MSDGKRARIADYRRINADVWEVLHPDTRRCLGVVIKARGVWWPEAVHTNTAATESDSGYPSRIEAARALRGLPPL